MQRFIQNLALRAGKILRDGFRTEFKISQKTATYDLVTEFDLAAERFIIDKIQKKYPSHGIIGEESGHIKKRKNFWLIDPLDGTHSFCRGLPYFSTSIAYVHNNKLKVGAVYAPAMDELYLAAAGKGATLNGKKIGVSQTAELKYAIISPILGTSRTTLAERAKIYNKIVIKNWMWMEKIGSAALTLAYGAAGRYDAVLCRHLSPWDYAAGALILEEAGAKVTDLKGARYRWDGGDILGANPKLHSELLGQIKRLKL